MKENLHLRIRTFAFSIKSIWRELLLLLGVVTLLAAFGPLDRLAGELRENPPTPVTEGEPTPPEPAPTPASQTPLQVGSVKVCTTSSASHCSPVGYVEDGQQYVLWISMRNDIHSEQTHLTAQVAFSNSSGNLILQQTCETPNNYRSLGVSLSLPCNFTLPQGTSRGHYRISVRVRDNLTGQVADGTYWIRVVVSPRSEAALLLKKGEQAFLEGRLTDPPTDSALAYARKAKKLDPQNPGGQNLEERSIGAIIDQIRLLRYQKDYEVALHVVEKAIELAPERADLRDWRSTIEEEWREGKEDPQPYAEPSAGILSWSGEIDSSPGEVIIEAGNSNTGTVQGRLPGVGCQIEIVFQTKPIAIVEPPGPSNNWSRVVVRASRKGKQVFLLRWTVLNPSVVK